MPRKKTTRKKAPPKRPRKKTSKTKAKAEVIEPEIIDAEYSERDVRGVADYADHTDTTAIATYDGGATTIARVGDMPSASNVLATWLADKHENTVRKYRGDLGDFAAWWMERAGAWDCEDDGLGTKVPMPQIGSSLQAFLALPRTTAFDAGMQYRTWLDKTRKLAPNTINRKLAALRSYVKLCKQVGAVNWDLPVEGVTAERVRDVKGPGEDGYSELVEAAERKIEAAIEADDERSRLTWVRNLALLRLYHDAGLRRMEPLNIDYPEDVDLKRIDNARLRFRRKKRKVKAWFAIGSKRAVRAVRDWIAERGDEPGPLFFSLHLGHRGKALNTRSVNKMLTKLGEEAGIEVATHGLRHTAATTLLNKTDGNVRAVAEFLGHKNLNIVQHYDDERKQQAKKMGSLLDDED